jgi:hypothetical protein
MSVTVLRLIPTDPAYVPDTPRRQAGRAVLATAVGGLARVGSVVKEEVGFVDCGENFERVSCPRCPACLEKSWWGETMDKAYLTGFRDLAVILPCCGAVCSLNDLNYDWPAGFARYVLEAKSPEVAELDEQQLRTLEEALGCRLRIIWARY